MFRLRFSKITQAPHIPAALILPDIASVNNDTGIVFIRHPTY
jgi:hypothetical protein